MITFSGHLLERSSTISVCVWKLLKDMLGNTEDSSCGNKDEVSSTSDTRGIERLPLITGLATRLSFKKNNLRVFCKPNQMNSIIKTKYNI